MGLFGMDEFVFDYRHCTDETLIGAFDQLWAKQDDLRRRIGDQLPLVESAIRETAAAVVRRIATRWPRHFRPRESAMASSAGLDLQTVTHATTNYD